MARGLVKLNPVKKEAARIKAVLGMHPTWRSNSYRLVVTEADFPLTSLLEQNIYLGGKGNYSRRES